MRGLHCCKQSTGMIVCVEVHPIAASCHPPPTINASTDCLRAGHPYWSVWNEFPTIRLDLRGEGGAMDVKLATTLERAGDLLEIGCEQWQDPGLDFWRFDERVDLVASHGPTTVVLAGAPGWPSTDVVAVLTRCQRWIQRDNAFSRTHLFRRISQRFRAMFDFDKPLALADYRHAVDTWQWALRLDSQAGMAVQLAALLHDVERLASETERRVEHHAPDYQAFKDAHASRGAQMARELLLNEGASAALADRASELVMRHERPDAAPELSLLNDADGLSFFSLNSAGYLDYFGSEATKRKVRYTLARMRPESVERLKSLRLRAEITTMLVEEADS
jgi:hypothetical protein